MKLKNHTGHAALVLIGIGMVWGVIAVQFVKFFHILK